MKFDKSRVYTALNADELKAGSVCFFADNLAELEERVNNQNEHCEEPCDLCRVRIKACDRRFVRCDGVAFQLAYLILPPKEKVLKWTDLKFGDIVKDKHSEERTMVTGIDHCDKPDHELHVHFATQGWMTDDELENWEKEEL